MKYYVYNVNIICFISIIIIIIIFNYSFYQLFLSFFVFMLCILYFRVSFNIVTTGPLARWTLFLAQ